MRFNFGNVGMQELVENENVVLFLFYTRVTRILDNL